MHNRDKHPEIWAAKEKAESELKPLLVERKIHTDEMKKLQKEIQKLEDRKTALNDGAMKDAERINELNHDIANFAKAMGAKTASGS